MDINKDIYTIYIFIKKPAHTILTDSRAYSCFSVMGRGGEEGGREEERGGRGRGRIKAFIKWFTVHQKNWHDKFVSLYNSTVS